MLWTTRAKFANGFIALLCCLQLMGTFLSFEQQSEVLRRLYFGLHDILPFDGQYRFFVYPENWDRVLKFTRAEIFFRKAEPLSGTIQDVLHLGANREDWIRFLVFGDETLKASIQALRERRLGLLKLLSREYPGSTRVCLSGYEFQLPSAQHANSADPKEIFKQCL